MPPPEKQLKEMGLREIRALARTRMPAEAWEHFMGAAESGATLRRNQRALGRFLFRQKIFHDITNPDTSIELFGRKLPIPAAIAPVGSFSLISDDAERQVAEAGADLVGLFAAPVMGQLDDRVALLIAIADDSQR